MEVFFFSDFGINVPKNIFVIVLKNLALVII